ncbi:MAG: DUF1587 domain-containing protein, partial [Planctomycetota bacterium]
MSPRAYSFLPALFGIHQRLLMMAWLGIVGSPLLADDHEKTGSSDSVGQLLICYCSDCHAGPTPEANILLDQPLQTLGTASHMARMERALKAVQSGQMPPEEVVDLGSAERLALSGEIKALLFQSATAARRLRPSAGNRRMTRDEYNFTMQQLFGINAEFSDLLPADALSADGYRNDIDRTALSSFHLEAYLASARRAVQRYVQLDSAKREKRSLSAEDLRYAIEFEDLYYSTADRYQGLERAPRPMSLDEFRASRQLSIDKPPRFTDPLSPRLPGAYSDDEMLRAAIPKLHQQYVAYPERLPVGELIVRVRAAGTPDRFGRFPMMRVEAGITLGDGCSIDSRSLGVREVRAALDQPATYEFRFRLEDLPAKGDLKNDDWVDRLSIFDLSQIFISNTTPDSEAIFARGRGAYATPKKGSEAIAESLDTMRERQTCFLYLDRLEVEMLPGVGKGNQSDRWQLAAHSESTEATPANSAVPTLRKQLRDFMSQAFRRPVSEQEVASKLGLFQRFREQGMSPQESL